MLTHRALFIARLRGYWPTTGRTWLLVALSAGYVLSLVLVLVGALMAGVGAFAWPLVLVNAACLALDWPGYWTVGRRLHWRQMRLWARVALVGLAVVFYAALAVLAPLWVLVPAIRQAWRTRQTQIAARPGEIAHLERDLGL